MRKPVRQPVRKVVLVIAALAVAGLATTPRLAAQSDLDAFMKKVLDRRDENWKKLQQYILDERDAIDIRGPGQAPIWGERRDFTWYIRDGFFIKSPVKVNGVTISEADRRKEEDAYLKRAKSRDRKPEPVAVPAAPAPAADAPVAARPEPEALQADLGLLRQTRQPEFMDAAYFLRFKFEQGTYALVGKETYAGQEVLKIEYYPTRLFSHEQDKQEKQAKARAQAKDPAKVDRETEMEATIEKLMNKVSLVTLWVEPKAAQIVKYTFDNVNFDFLPAAWLLRVNDINASMTMHQAFPDVWLPRDVDFYFAAMLAIGAFDVRYHIDYRDYRQATTSGRIK